MTPNYVYRAVIRRVIDGDTIRVDWDLGAHIWLRDVPLRLLGIDAPEMRGVERPAGVAARNYLATLLPEGVEITIQTEKGDSFGRYLAWVWRDGIQINQVMFVAGHAKEMTV